jgi:hypothetical protein
MIDKELQVFPMSNKEFVHNGTTCHTPWRTFHSDDPLAEGSPYHATRRTIRGVHDPCFIFIPRSDRPSIPACRPRPRWHPRRLAASPATAPTSSILGHRRSPRQPTPLTRGAAGDNLPTGNAAGRHRIAPPAPPLAPLPPDSDTARRLTSFAPRLRIRTRG